MNYAAFSSPCIRALRARRLRLAFGLSLLFALPTPAAGQSPLGEVPSSCPVVVHLRGVERTKDRALEALESALPAGREPRALLRNLKERLDGALTGKLVPGRSVQGLPKDGPVFLALTDLPEGPNDLLTSLVLIARVSRYTAFRDALLSADERKDLDKRDGYETTTLADRPIFFVERKDYAIVTLRRDVARRFTKAQPGLDRKLDAETAKQLLDADLSLYLDPSAVGKRYGKALLEARRAMEKSATAKDGPFATSPELAPMFKELLKGATQFLGDSRAVLLTAKAEPEGLQLHGRILIDRSTKAYIPRNDFGHFR